MSAQTLAFLSLAFVFAFTPGATTAVVIRHTLAGGRRRGLTAAAGAMTASLIQAMLALAGVSTLLVKWPEGLRALAIAGALFLAWLGLKSLRAAVAPGTLAPGTFAPGNLGPSTLAPGNPVPLTPYRDGFFINVFNPSVTSFYVGVVPTFVPAGSSWHALAFLYAAHMSIAMSCHVFWSSLFSKARTLFAGERPRRWLDAAVGVLLLYLAVRVLRR